jgi:hypothetical protein
MPKLTSFLASISYANYRDVATREIADHGAAQIEMVLVEGA